MEAFLAAIVGAVVGGGVTIWATHTTLRAERRARADEREAERDLRREERDAERHVIFLEVFASLLVEVTPVVKRLDPDRVGSLTDKDGAYDHMNEIVMGVRPTVSRIIGTAVLSRNPQEKDLLRRLDNGLTNLIAADYRMLDEIVAYDGEAAESLIEAQSIYNNILSVIADLDFQVTGIPPQAQMHLQLRSDGLAAPVVEAEHESNGSDWNAPAEPTAS